MKALFTFYFLLFTFYLFSAVPAPWTAPVEKDGRVSVWGRDYAYASNALPVTVTAQGSDLLAVPRVGLAGQRVRRPLLVQRKR